jgi:type VI secretion system protein ImpL
VSLDNCPAPEDFTPQYGDYFIQVRNSLLRSLADRCEHLAGVKIANDARIAREKKRAEFEQNLESYREIEERFNNSDYGLAGKFPFSDLPLTELFAEADPEAINSFFELLDKNKAKAMSALAQCEQYNLDCNDATDFLAQMEKVRIFFASFLQKKPLYPLFNFNIKFRVNEGNEWGARQIIDWEFGVGKKKVRYGDANMTGAWGYTDPLVLTMRWANNAPTVPDSKNPAQTNMKINEKSVTVVFNNNWSLLLLLLRQRARGSDFDKGVKGVDIEPYTLKFRVNTATNAALPNAVIQAQPPDLRAGQVVAFMRVGLMAPSQTDPLIMPETFPVKAPKPRDINQSSYTSSGQE